MQNQSGRLVTRRGLLLVSKELVQASKYFQLKNVLVINKQSPRGGEHVQRMTRVHDKAEQASQISCSLRLVEDILSHSQRGAFRGRKPDEKRQQHRKSNHHSKITVVEPSSAL